MAPCTLSPSIQWWCRSSQNSWLHPFFGWRIPSGKLTWLWKITIFNGKTHYKWPFSIAMLNYQRGTRQWGFTKVMGEVEVDPWHRPWMPWMPWKHLGAEVIDLLSRSPTTCGGTNGDCEFDKARKLGWPMEARFWPNWTIRLSGHVFNWLCHI